MIKFNIQYIFMSLYYKGNFLLLKIQYLYEIAFCPHACSLIIIAKLKCKDQNETIVYKTT